MKGGMGLKYNDSRVSLEGDGVVCKGDRTSDLRDV